MGTLSFFFSFPLFFFSYFLLIRYVVQKGKEVGIDAVANKAIVEVIKRIERGEIVANEENFQLLQQFIQ
jgi:hypothetical protein